MANDPGLSNDNCIFLEAITGDGGVHNATDVWWLSPDLKLIGPVSGPDTADGGQTNSLEVKLHRKPASSNCAFPGDESVSVEVWVANPSLAISPSIHNSAARVGFIGSPVPDEGTDFAQQVDWDASPSPHLNDPENPGQKCLVARAYPSSGVPNGASFFVPGDQHVAQRNLCVIKNPVEPVTFRVNSFGFGHPAPIINPVQNAKLRAVLDLHPSHFVRDTIISRLASFPGFQHFRTTPLRAGFKFDLTSLHASAIVDHSHSGVIPSLPPNANPTFEAKVVLKPGVITSLTFLADARGMAIGEACIFHLIQTSLNDVAQGGLTLVVLRL